MRRSPLVRCGLRLIVLLPVLIGPMSDAGAQVPLATTDLRLPSDGAGGGTLAVRLTYPAFISDYRFPDGAPVTIYLPGGFAAGGLGGSPRLSEQGFVMVTFLFPGGIEGSHASDGVYDYRGDNCQRALRDVIRFAEGAATDSLGRTIRDIVPGPVHPGIVGFAPFSNGLIGLITLDRYGGEIPFSPFQAGWENPTNGPVITADLGANRLDCDTTLDTDGNGMPGDDAKNPWYDPATGYGPTTFAVDFSGLAWDPLYPGTYIDATGRCAPAGAQGAVLHDGRANGRLDFNPLKPTCLDYDGDGILEKTEDYLLTGITTFSQSCLLKVHFSPEVTRALRDQDVFPASWPVWIATVEDADDWWPLRDATVHFSGIASRFPDFKAITVYTKQDHVQAQDDHVHVRQVLDGMAAHGLWFRLNADSAYFEEVFGSLPAEYVETPANAAVPTGEMKSHAEPRGTSADFMSAAAHAEMADRIHAGTWWSDLDASLRPLVDPEPEAAEIFIGGDGWTIGWPPAAGAFSYDLLRGDVAGLSDDGTRVILGGAVCLDDDSPDSLSGDASTPPPGHAFYYLVKPNGLHGTYGFSSAGHPRIDAAQACPN